MNKESVFTSTGSKIMHHPELVSRLQQKKAIPISIQIAPTSRCQLNCIFCSNTNRKEQQDLDFKDLSLFLYSMSHERAKTVEWTGGGDPLMYHSINESIQAAHDLGFEQGFITNGLGFKNLTEQSLSLLAWVRVSMNCLDYVPKVEIPELQKETVLGFSYVMNDNTSNEILARVKCHVLKYKPEYVRIVPNCQATDEEQEENNEYFSKLISSWGDPYFYQRKVFRRPEKCYWGYIKPFLLHDGFVYRCSSVVLNSDAGRSFHENFRWCHMKEFPLKYSEEILPYIPGHCDKCVFAIQNDLVDEIITPSKMSNFL